MEASVVDAVVTDAVSHAFSSSVDHGEKDGTSEAMVGGGGRSGANLESSPGEGGRDHSRDRARSGADVDGTLNEGGRASKEVGNERLGERSREAEERVCEASEKAW